MALHPLGAAFGVWRAYQHGWASPLWDILRGAGIGFAYFALTMLLILATLALGQLHRPSFPPCRYRPFGRWRPDPDGRARGRPAE
ncbi:MAG: hypothetical protein ACM36B_18750 [Bacteroidota bacterium]